MFSQCDLVNTGKDHTILASSLPTTVHSQNTEREGNPNHTSSHHYTNVRAGYEQRPVQVNCADTLL